MPILHPENADFEFPMPIFGILHAEECRFCRKHPEIRAENADFIADFQFQQTQYVNRHIHISSKVQIRVSSDAAKIIAFAFTLLPLLLHENGFTAKYTGESKLA